MSGNFQKRWCGAVAGGLGLVVVAVAQPLARSPFLPPETGSVATPPPVTENAPLQFVGQLGEGEEAMYSVFNPATRRAVWLRVGETAEDLALQAYDAGAETVRVQHGGRVLALRLEAAKAPPRSATVPAAVAVTGGNTLTSTVRVNPTPADEARRLEAVAAEVRRRRALRQQAADQAAQNPQQSGG